MITKYIRSFLSKNGYHIFKEGFMPKGIYLHADMKRIISLDSVKTVVDVGAFQGQMTDYFLKIFPSSKVLAIEPFPGSFEIVKKRFHDNQRVDVLNLGVGHSDEEIVFRLFENGELNSFKVIHNDEAESTDSLRVNVKRLDTIVTTLNNSFDDIDFLKIDVEGFELQCIEGASSLLDSKVGVILIEAGFCDDDHRHTSFQAIGSQLKNFGFSFYGLYDLYHYRKPTELLFANALFINENYLKKKGLLL